MAIIFCQFAIQSMLCPRNLCKTTRILLTKITTFLLGLASSEDDVSMHKQWAYCPEWVCIGHKYANDSRGLLHMPRPEKWGEGGSENEERKQRPIPEYFRSTSGVKFAL